MPYTRWRHQMETFAALLARCAGNLPVTGEFPVQRPVMWIFSLICVWINDWVNKRESGDLRRHPVHYDVIIMAKNGVFVCSITVESENGEQFCIHHMQK